MTMNSTEQQSRIVTMLDANTSRLTLDELNDGYAQYKIGGIVFVGLMMVIGIVGNVHVLYLYSFKFPKSNHRIYILWLALLDIITCSLGMPLTLFELRNPFKFDHAWLCKILRFTNYFNSTGSALILVVIAVDRFKKICRPFRTQMTKRTAKISGGIVMLIAAFFSWPAPVLYGHSTVNTKFTGITGVACSTEDRFKGTGYQTYYNVVLIVGTFVCVIILIILYLMIIRKIWKQTNIRTHLQKDTCSIKYSTCEKPNTVPDSSSSGLSVDSSSTRSASKDKSTLVRNNTLNLGSEDSKRIRKDADARASRTKRTTIMLCIITVVYILAFIPHLSLQIAVFLNEGFLENLNVVGLILFNIFLWTFFINNVTNPIIYSFCDPRFRKEIRVMYRKCRK